MASSKPPAKGVAERHTGAKPLGVRSGTNRDAPFGQRERFEQAACELGVDLDEEKLREALRRLAPRDKDEPSQEPRKG
jgi:hypothetical protein